MPVPKIVAASEPISEVTKITDPVKTENVAGTQINPATEDTLSALNTKVSTDATLSALSTKVGEVAASPTANTVLARLKEILTGTVLAAGSALIGKVKLVTSAGAEINPATEDTLAKASPATAPVTYNVTLTSADTEYSQALSANTKKFAIHLRDYTAFRFAYVTGKVAGPTAPYDSIPTGGEKYEDNIRPGSITLYFASSSAGKVAEIEEWT